MPTNVRHETAPMPFSCRWCGVGQREHVQLWVLGHGWHGWVEPTRAQVEARMRVKLTKSRKTPTTTTKETV